MDVGPEINVAACLVAVTGETLGDSLFGIQVGGEILRIDFDVAHENRLSVRGYA